MKFNLDIEEIRGRESERIEWKKNVSDIDDVIKTIVAFSNDFSNLGGGYVICGAEEVADEAGFQSVRFVGLSSRRFKEIENKVLADCEKKVAPSVVPLVDEIEAPGTDKRVLAFIVPATEHAHSYRGSGKTSAAYYVRVGRTTREARNSILRELLVRKKALEPWDRRKNQSAAASDIDLVAMREYLQNMGLWDPARGIEQYLSAKESISAFVPPLMASQALTSTLHPRNFTLLLFCSQPTRFFPGAYSILSVYPGEDRGDSISERTEIAGTLVEQTKQIIARLNTESQTAIDKTSQHPNQLKYPPRALQEAAVNAIVHRDYESDQPTRITIFSDRIEFNSPGALPRAVDKTLFFEGKATPFWRNQALAYFFNKLQLAQAEGQGIPTIIRTMRDEGCPDPIFTIGEENLVCTLPAHPRHKRLRQIRSIENDLAVGNYKDALLQIESILEVDPHNFRVREFIENDLPLLEKLKMMAAKPEGDRKKGKDPEGG